MYIISNGMYIYMPVMHAPLPLMGRHAYIISNSMYGGYETIRGVCMEGTHMEGI